MFTDYLIFALTGAALGAISDRGRASLGKFSVEVGRCSLPLQPRAGGMGG